MINENCTYMRNIQLKYTAVFFLITVILGLATLLFQYLLLLILTLYFLYYTLRIYLKYQKYLKATVNREESKSSLINTNNSKILFHKHGVYSAPTDEIITELNEEINITIQPLKGRTIKTTIKPTKARHNLIIKDRTVILK